MLKEINILSTKALSLAEIQFLLDANIAVDSVDFISINPKKFTLETVHDNLIFTSQNAVRSVLQHPEWERLKSKNAFAVGIKTKNLLTANGFNVIAYTGYAADLAEIISLVYGKESYTFFCGNLRRDVLPNTLKENGVQVNEIEVYETKLTPKKNTKKVDGILFFSPSAVESYLKTNTLKNEICFCIGETTAKALAYKNTITAAHPTVELLLQEVVTHFSGK